MINRRRQTKEREAAAAVECCSPSWRLKRKTSAPLLLNNLGVFSLLVLIICIASGLTVAQLSPEEYRMRTRGYGAAESPDEDLQVIFTGPMVTPPSSLSPDVTSSISLYEQELARCKLSQSKIRLAVLRSGTWSEVNERKLSKALAELSRFFAIPREFFNLDDISLDGLHKMLRNSFKSMAGNRKDMGTNFLGRKFSRLSFVVGCNNEMFPTGKLIANQIGEQMNEGLIADITDLNFDDQWWVWTEPSQNNRMNRRKRDTAVEGSGEAEEDIYADYDGEGDDDETDGITEVPSVAYESHAHRHHHGNSNNKPTTSDRDSSVEPIKTTVHGQNRFEDTVDRGGEVYQTTVGDSTNRRQSVQIDLTSVSTAGSTAAPTSTESIRRPMSTVSSMTTTHRGNWAPTTEPTSSSGTGGERTSSVFKSATSPTRDTLAPVVTPTLDPEMRESVSILESEIIKTIENNDKKLKEEQLNIERILNERKGHGSSNGPTTDFSSPAVIMTSSERSSYDLGLDFVTPIIETIPEDERIEVIQSSDFDFEEGLRRLQTEETPIIDIDNVDERPPKTSDGLKDGEAKKTEDGGNVIEDAGATPAVTSPTVTTSLPMTSTSTFAQSTATESVAIETTTLTATTISSIATGQVTTTVVPAVDNEAGVTESTAVVDEDDDYYDEEFEESATTSASTPSTIGSRLVPVVELATTAATTTTERLPTTTEVVEPEIVNAPPMIKSRIPKQPLTAGKPFSFTIPLETFFDAEDGTNLKLTVLDKNDQPLKSSSWIQFDENKREVYGLPLEEVVSRWQYKLHATDKGGESVVETLDLTVQQHKSHRSANHEISIVLKLVEKFNNSVDWQLQLIRGIIDLVSDPDMSNVVVREIRPNAQDSSAMTFVFTNDSLPKDKCPEEELKNLLKRFEMTSLNSILAPEIVVMSISGQQIGNCQKTNVAKPKPTPSIAKNYPPLTRNQVDRVSAVVGSLLVFQVPLDTFYDPEDKSDLKLSLLTNDRKKLDSRNWLQFDSKNREFYGIPLLMDVGQKEYLLVAEDSEGLTATDALVVTVTHPKPQRDHNAVIQLHLNSTVDSVNSPLLQRRFVERLALVFGDRDTSNIKVRALPQQYNRGQQCTFSYYNASIYRVHNQQCPDEEIDKLRTVLLERDGSLRDSVKITFGSDFRVFKAQFVPAGTCQAADNSIYDPIKPIRTSEKQVPTTTKDDYMMTFILPAAIILTMLLLGSIIACVLHRRRMTGKMELGDEEERRSFRSKGIPVIFHDELEEKPEIVTKSPIILKDEKPPLLPPSYNSTAIDGDSEDVDEYVPPPAVMMGNRESRGKSPVTPSYRKPPPYVSP